MRRARRVESGRVTRLAAEEPPSAPPPLPWFGELALAWARTYLPKRAKPEGVRILLRHLQPLFLLDEESLTVERIETLVDELRKEKEWSAGYANKVLDTGRRIVRHAKRHRRWKGDNVFALCDRHRPSEREYIVLTLAELALVQPCIPRQWRTLFRVAVHTGMRLGELFALRVVDVDFEKETIRIRRSHDRDETKTGKSRTHPIVDAIREDLRVACRQSKSGLVFGDAQGNMHRADTKMARMLRTAMIAARVRITGALYWCSRPALCGWREERSGPVTQLRCPRCNRRCNAAPRVEPMRWIDLRHTTNTLHEAHGCSDVVRRLALGHSLKGTNAATYTHPTVERMREELSRWSLSP